MIRVKVKQNGIAMSGKVIEVKYSSLDELLIGIGNVFNTQGFSRLFTADGYEIDEIDVIR